MPYSFTITDDYDNPRDEILKWAMDAAQEEIEMQGLDSNLLPQMTDFKEEGKKKIYTFVLMPSKKVSQSPSPAKREKIATPPQP